jgi:hypothetical protein
VNGRKAVYKLKSGRVNVGEQKYEIYDERRRRFYADTLEDARFLQNMLSCQSCSQIFKGGKPISAKYDFDECKLVDDGFYWSKLYEGQFMENRFPFFNQ